MASSDPPADRDDVDPKDSRHFLRGPIVGVIHLRILPMWGDYLTWDTVKVNTGKENDRTGKLSGAGT